MSRSKSWGKKSSQGGRREVLRLERWVLVCSSLYQCLRGGSRRWKLKSIKCIEDGRGYCFCFIDEKKWHSGSLSRIIQQSTQGHIWKHSFGANETLELEFRFAPAFLSLGTSYELLNTSVSSLVKWELHHLPCSSVMRTKWDDLHKGLVWILASVTQSSGCGL